MKLVKSILERAGGKKLLALAAPVLLIIICLLTLKIYLVRSWPETTLKDFVTEFIRDNFNKAVTFDDISISLFGNVVISNLNVSISSDFNDNISLIKSSTVTAHMRFLSLFGGPPEMKGITFHDPDMTIYKKYGKGYLETFKEIFSINGPIGEIRGIDHSRFFIDIDNSTLLYREVFRNDTLKINARSMNISLVLRDDVLLYDIAGAILPFQNTDLGRSRIRFTGKVRIGEGNRFTASDNSFTVKDFDLSYLNSYIREKLKESLNVEGGVDADFHLSVISDNVSLHGQTELTNLEIRDLQGNEWVNYISHENLNATLLLDGTDGFGRLVVRELDIYDDNIRLRLNGIYHRSSLEHFFDVHFESNAMDLAGVSENITPVKGGLFRGRLRFGGRARYDLAGGGSRGMRMDLELDDFGMTVTGKKGTRDVVRDMKMRLGLRDDRLKIDVHAKLSATELDVDWETHVKAWAPFSSESFVSLKSPLMEMKDLVLPLKIAVNGLYEGAYEDRKIGYEQIAFQKEPLGIFLNSNNLKGHCEIRKVLMGRKAELTDLVFDAGLRSGRFYVENFNVAGFGASYSLEAEGRFNEWMPAISISAAVRDFDLASFAAREEIRGEIAGKLNIGFDYRASASRLSQLLDTTLLDLSLEVNGGVLKNTDLQKELSEFLKKVGYDDTGVSDLTIPLASLAFSQRADRYNIGKIALYGDTLRFYARGKYDYYDGIQIPVELILKKPEGGAAEVKAPLEIKGPLARPVVVRAKGREDKNGTGGVTESLSLFHIN